MTIYSEQVFNLILPRPPTLLQSEASIQVMWSLSANQRPVSRPPTRACSASTWWEAKNDWISWRDLLQKAVSHKSKLFDDHNQLKNEGWKTLPYLHLVWTITRWSPWQQQDHSNPVQINWCLIFIFSIS